MSDVDDVLARAAGWQARLEARDVEGIREFMHEDYALVLVVPSDVTVPLAEWLGMLPDYVVHTYEIHHQVAHVEGDTAAILTSATQHATVKGGDRSGRFVISDVWLRSTGGQWRIWRRHSTPATAGAIPRLGE
jgi:ketosteroid isomerase-like protein